VGKFEFTVVSAGIIKALNIENTASIDKRLYWHTHTLNLFSPLISSANCIKKSKNALKLYRDRPKRGTGGKQKHSYFFGLSRNLRGFHKTI
jgi:hypothetical protein